MKRTILTVALILGAVATGAEYRLVLADGTVLVVDSAPDVRNGAVYFSVGGAPRLLPLSGVDLVRSESANAPSEKAGEGGTAAAPRPPRRFTDEDLRNGSEPAPAGGSAERVAPEAGAPAGDPSLESRGALSREEKGLLQRRGLAEERLDGIRIRREDLDQEDARRRADYARLPTDPYAVAASQDWDAEYRRKASALEAERAELAAEVQRLDRQIQSLRTQMRDQILGP